MPRALIAVALLAVSACSGGSTVDDLVRRQQGITAKPASGGAKPAATAAAAAVLPKNLPPASMFIGSASWRTGPSRYCRTDACTDLTPQKPSALLGPAGSPVLFSLSAAPLSATLEVAVPGGAVPTVVPLNPGTSMVWQASLAPGTYPVTLIAAYKEAVVSWPFALRLAAAK